MLSYNGPWRLDPENRTDPVPGEDEVLIKVLATGLCGSDIHGFTGSTGRRTAGQIMGHETAGTVVELGENVTGLEIDDLVAIYPIVACNDCELCHAGAQEVCESKRVIGVDPSLPGSLSELMVVPGRNVVRLNPAISPLHGALVEPLAVGYHAVTRLAPVTGDRLLILGGGPIGQACAIGAARSGIDHIVVSEPSAERRAIVESLGFRATDPADLDRAIADELGGPPNAVVDAVGVSETLRDALTHSAPLARIVLVGMGSPEVSVDSYAISAGEKTVIGSYTSSERTFRDTAEWVSAGRPELDRMIGDLVDLDSTAVALTALADGTSRSNKTIVVVSADPTPELR